MSEFNEQKGNLNGDNSLSMPSEWEMFSRIDPDNSIKFGLPTEMEKGDQRVLLEQLARKRRVWAVVKNHEVKRVASEPVVSLEDYRVAKQYEYSVITAANTSSYEAYLILGGINRAVDDFARKIGARLIHEMPEFPSEARQAE